MGSTQFGNFNDFCRDSTLPVCNLFTNQTNPANKDFGGCPLTGIPLSNDRHLGNLGSIILAFISILAALFFLWRSERKKAAVGRREMQLFLVAFIVVEICEIFTVGGFPLHDSVRKGFTAVHIASITAACWILMLNAAVGYQVLDDGTPISMTLVLGSALVFFIGTGYIALDTAFGWTGQWNHSWSDPHRNIALYVLYQLWPLICLVIFYVLESILVIRILREIRPMVYLSLAGLLFAIGQIFNYVISTHLCQATGGKINGALFETFFTLLSVVMIYIFWTSITEDDWPMPMAQGGGYN